MRIPSQHRSRGFSLLEVLIAVVVLATGLLAMAALQARLASSSADAKARSRIAALLSSVLDDQRANGYASIATFASTGCNATGTSLEQAICTAQTDGGISGLTLVQTVAQYYGIKGGGNFTTTVPGAGSNYADYKLVTLSARWTDATGGPRTLSATNIASALNITGSSTFINTPLTLSKLTPMVHEENPANTAGVIPIAVGANTDAASTNPLPTIDKALTSTSFSTLTYSAGANDGSYSRTIQKRVETTVAECVCQLSSSNPFVDKHGSLDLFLGSSSFRPTYWNGTKYAPPSDARVTPYSGQHPDLVGEQNDLCSVVCRDHHDKNELTNVATSDTVKYDAVTGDVNRYKATVTTSGNGNNATTTVKLTLNNNAPVAATASGDAYLDAARLIRVDGLWRVATDLHAEHMGLLATSPKGQATSPTPDSSSEAAYEDFVVDYMGQKLTQLLLSGSAPAANTIYASHGLDIPDTIDAVTTTNSYRYLHARGLYLDTLEAPALAKLTSVNSACAAADFPTCLLPYLPFNTINVTQLANWKAKSKTDTTNGKITVTNSTTSNAVTTCSSSNSIRGCVSGSSASTGTTNLDRAIAELGKSNSAVAASAEVSPYELNSSNKLSDSQQFTVTGSATSSEFFANITGPSVTIGSTTLPFWTVDLSTTNEPWARWSITTGTGTAADYCFANIGRTDTNPNPYDCVTTMPLTWSATTPLQVTVGNYNQVVQQTVSNPCSGGTGTYSQPTLVCYTVNSASVANSGTGSYSATVVAPTTNVKSALEQTVINITGNGGAASPIPAAAATLNLTFSANGTATGSYTCDAVTAVPTFTTPTTCN